MKNKEAIEAYKHRLKNEVDISEKELIDELQTSSNNLEKIIDKVVMGGVAISGIYLLAQVVKTIRKRSENIGEGDKELVVTEKRPSLGEAIKSAAMKQLSLVILKAVRKKLMEATQRNSEQESEKDEYTQ
ncbi:MAG TPA: hypothetical protein DDY13_03970 [Cytophagales bacterium]|jgi:uncharacterized membrane protein YqhA|nr:hypothetical protein [Cytophagales bacterium]